MGIDEKKAAHAVRVSTGGGAKEGFASTLFTFSVPETGPKVKGRTPAMTEEAARAYIAPLSLEEKRKLLRLLERLEGKTVEAGRRGA